MYLLQTVNEDAYFEFFEENNAILTTNANKAMQFAFRQDAVNFNTNYLNNEFIAIFDETVIENEALVNYD